MGLNQVHRVILILLCAESIIIVSTHHHHHHHHHFYPETSQRQVEEDNYEESGSNLNPLSHYGPSIISLTKYNKDINGPTIFHPQTGRLLHLEDYPNFSVTVPLAPDNASATSNHVFVSRRLSGPGEFLVVAPEGHGVMAVIQSMDLRTAPSGCNDFIQFGEVDSGVETAGTCGKVDNSDGSFAPSALEGPRVFLSPSGKMKVLFYHGYIWGLVRNFNFDLLDPSRNSVLTVEIVFTAYKACESEDDADPIPHRSCTSSVGRTCIPAPLFCDRVINCAFEENFGSDEYVGNCLPTLLNVLLPQVIPAIRDPILALARSIAINQTSVLISENNNAIVSTSTQSSVSVTNISPKSFGISTSPRTSTHFPISTTPIPEILSTRATTLRTTTAIPSTSTTSTTTTPTTLPTAETTELVLSETSSKKGEALNTEIPFTKKLHQHIIEIPRTSIVREIEDSITLTPTPTINSVIESTTPPTPTILEVKPSTVGDSGSNKINDFEAIVDPAYILNFSDPKPITISPVSNITNMTFAGISNGLLTVDEGEGQVDQLQGGGSDSDAQENFVTEKDQNASIQSSDEDASVTLWVIFAIAILIAAVIMLRLYCFHNRAIWIPNPRGLKSQKENSAFSDPSHFPEVHVNNKKKPETPPSYDILFPKSCLHDADVLP